MNIELAEAIVAACHRQGVRAAVEPDYSASWMRGHKTTGVVLTDGDLAQVISAVVANPQLFIEEDSPKFAGAESLRVSPFRLSLILY